MSDEELRALERTAANDTSQAFALARALERAGRSEEAWVALCRAVDRPDVRAELITRPAWTHPLGPGQTRALDVPPVRTTPRERWRAKVTDGRRLLASPLGVVVLEGVADRPTAVLDPRTGERRWTPDQFTRDAWLDGGLLLAHRRLEELHACRLWAEDGEERPDVGRHPLRAAPERLELAVDEGGLRVVARPLLAPLREGRDLEWPEPQVVGRAGLAVARVLGASAIVADERVPGASVLVGQSHEQVVWARDLGQQPAAAERWTHPGRFGAADAQGVVVLDVGAHDTTARLLDLDGRERWSTPGQQLVALGPRHVVLGPHLVTRRNRPFGASAVRVHERSTGDRRVDVPLQDTRVRGCLVRDLLVLPGADETLAAWRLDGAPVWRVQVGDVVDLAPLPGALVVLLDDRQVVCLEEGPTAP